MAESSRQFAQPCRRDFLRTATGAAAFCAGLSARWAKAAEDARASEAFTFVVVNDVHYFDRKCAAWLSDHVIHRINEHKPDFCLIVGDLTEHGTPEQNAGIKDVLGGLNVPVHVVVGNHDHQAGSNDRRAFEDHWPKSINYHFEHKGWQFLGLDTTQGHAGSRTAIHRDTLSYARDALAKLDRKRPTAVFTHFPLGHFVPSRPSNANDLLALFREQNLRAVFNGHFHSKTERPWGEALVTTNTCCSFRRKNHDFDPRKGYFLCTARDGTVERKYVQVNG